MELNMNHIFSMSLSLPLLKSVLGHLVHRFISIDEILVTVQEAEM